MSQSLELYTCKTDFFDYDHPDFDTFLAGFEPSENPRDTAIRLYEKVRDAFHYNPYHLDITSGGLKASTVLKQRRAWCVEKANVLIACLRRFGIPARPGYAIVTNHIGVEKLTAYLRRKEIVFHGYVDVLLDDNWVKCTPAFDERLCRLTDVSPLPFDGKTDSLFQEYEKGRKFMEYLHDYGSFTDVPLRFMNAEMKTYYPHLFENDYDSAEFSFRHE